MQGLQDSYLAAYRSLKLTRGAGGIVPGDGIFTAWSYRVGAGRAEAEVMRRNTRIHFIQPLKERLVREVGYGLSLEGASAADLVKSMQARSKLAAQKGKVA